ncbi:unnamed protein product [Dicrocoelium dendriticum]|nr:unnamed protein product [Dicrocoelium dendriticum]
MPIKLTTKYLHSRDPATGISAKRCPPCTKEEPDVPLEGPVEEHSVTSGSQLYPLTALAGPYTVDHQRHRSGEPVYHPSYDVNEHAYGLTPHTPISESGCASPSVSYNTMTYWQPERRKIAKFTELPPKKQSDKSGNEMSMLAVLPDDKVSNNECARNASCYLPPTRTNKKRQPSSEWPPPHQGNNVVDYMRLMGQTRSTLKENSMSKFLAKSSLNSPSNLYQSIEFRVALDSGVPRKCDTGGSAFTPPELSHVPKLTKKQIYNRTESEMGSNCKRRGADPEINYSSPVKGLHRANSDRTGYVQTSFV